MAYSTISKPSLHFNTKLYTGNGSTNAITGVGFQPDWVWIKNRVATSSHNIFDVVRGATKAIFANATDVEATEASRLSAFNSDGFTINGDTSNQTNANGSAFVSWNWKAGGSQGTSNTDGSINTTYTSVNTTAGFSISSYTGTGSAATVGHGLGVAPKMIIVKNLSSSENWGVWHTAIAADKYLGLNQTGAVATNSAIWNNTLPTNTVFSIGNNARTGGSHNYVAYCFAEKKGYSKFGTYIGNGNADGTFVYTGFKPAFTLIKRDGTDNWPIHDNRRPERGGNPNDAVLRANLSDASYGGSQGVDFLSNGFKARQNDGEFNNNGSTYIYMAFADEPLVANVGANGIPNTAR